MAALNRPTEATYVIHDRVTVETLDREDHTFCGVVFPVKCKDNLPVDHIVINSISVRGRLGPLTVWVTKEQQQQDHQQQQRPRAQQFRMNPRFWTKIYEKTHRPSFRQYATLDLSTNPIRMKPGQVKAIYIHSTLPSDEAIVYDDKHHSRTYDDALLSILTGRAHVSPTPFGTTPIWGWGNPWRDNREFVGRIQYGAVYKLWNPSQSLAFGTKFQNLVWSLFLCQRRWESPMSMLPDDCIFYIINMCRWDWANDTPDDMKQWKKKRIAIRQAAEEKARLAAQQEQEAAVAAASATSSAKSESVLQSPSKSSVPMAGTTCCTRSCTRSCDERENENQDSDEESVESNEEEQQQEVEDSDDDDDDDDDDEWDEDDENGDDNDDDNDDASNDGEMDWDENVTSNEVFRYHDDSDDEVPSPPQGAEGRPAWLRRQFARIHVLHALTRLDDNSVVSHGV